MFEKIKACFKKLQYSISVREDGLLVNSMLGLREEYIKWEDIDLINAVQIFPGSLKLEILYQGRKYLFLFKDMSIWDEALKVFCEQLPSFSIEAVEEAKEDIYEQLHLCWEKEK
ncbi:MAG: hypothetical protein KAS23_15235 [Anaerohalosphaera sp.]|nr:hypothetical protein [Anaerohalosphaera sp.]